MVLSICGHCIWTVSLWEDQFYFWNDKTSETTVWRCARPCCIRLRNMAKSFRRQAWYRIYIWSWFYLRRFRCVWSDEKQSTDPWWRHEEVSETKRAASLFTRDMHHKNVSVWFVLQNLYKQGPSLRSIVLNCQAFVPFRSCTRRAPTKDTGPPNRS